MLQDDPQSQTGQSDRQVSLPEWEEIVREKHGIPREAWNALSKQESGDKVNAVSPTGVRGKYQVTERTARGYGLDRNDPYQQVVAAAKHFKAQYDTLGHIPDEGLRWTGAYAKYYGGDGAVKPDGTLSTGSQDQVSTPAKAAESYAKKLGNELRQNSGQAQQPARPAASPFNFQKPVAQTLDADAAQRDALINPAQRRPLPPPAPVPMTGNRLRQQAKNFLRQGVQTPERAPEDFQAQLAAEKAQKQQQQADYVAQQQAKVAGQGRLAEAGTRLTRSTIQSALSPGDLVAGSMATPLGEEMVRKALKQDEIKRGLDDYLPVDPTKKQTINPLNPDFYSVTVPEVVGNVLPMMATGKVLPAGLAARLGATGVGMLQSAGQGYEEARAAGMTREEAQRHAGAEGLIATTEMLGGEAALGQAQHGLRPILKDIAKDVSQEAYQQVLSNLNARYYSGLDPQRPLSQDVAQSAMGGFIVSGGANGAHAAAEAAANRVAPRYDALARSTQAQEFDQSARAEMAQAQQSLAEMAAQQTQPIVPPTANRQPQQPAPTMERGDTASALSLLPGRAPSATQQAAQPATQPAVRQTTQNQQREAARNAAIDKTLEHAQNRLDLTDQGQWSDAAEAARNEAAELGRFAGTLTDVAQRQQVQRHAAEVAAQARDLEGLATMRERGQRLNQQEAQRQERETQARMQRRQINLDKANQILASEQRRYQAELAKRQAVEQQTGQTAPLQMPNKLEVARMARDANRAANASNAENTALDASERRAEAERRGDWRSVAAEWDAEITALRERQKVAQSSDEKAQVARGLRNALTERATVNERLKLQIRDEARRANAPTAGLPGESVARPQRPQRPQPPQRSERLLNAVENEGGGVPKVPTAPVNFGRLAEQEAERAFTPEEREGNASLESFVVKNGGVRPSANNRGDLSYGQGREGGRPGFISNEGTPVDEMRRQANEAGFGPYETEADFLNALRDARNVFSERRRMTDQLRDDEAEYYRNRYEQEQQFGTSEESAPATEASPNQAPAQPSAKLPDVKTPTARLLAATPQGSPYARLVGENRAQVDRLHDLPPGSPDAEQVWQELRSFARQNSIGRNHLGALADSVRNYQSDRAKSQNLRDADGPRWRRTRQSNSEPLSGTGTTGRFRPETGTLADEAEAALTALRRTEAESQLPRTPTGELGGAPENLAPISFEERKQFFASMKPQELDAALQALEERRNDTIRRMDLDDEQRAEIEREIGRDLQAANKQRHELVRQKLLPAKIEKPESGEGYKKRAVTREELDRFNEAMERRDNPRRGMNTTDLARFNSRIAPTAALRSSQASPTEAKQSSQPQPSVRKVRHDDPNISGQPVLAETKDGRLIVPNAENDLGISIVKGKQGKFSSTQVNLSGEIADAIKAYAQKIPDSNLADDGRETEPHITVKYGLHDEAPDAVGALLAGQPPIRVKFGKVSLFENDDADVVKVEIESDDLRKLNAKIAKALPNTETHADYTPHATIAYVKPGMGKKYAGDNFLAGRETTIDHLLFSSKNGQQTEFPLQGQSVPQRPVKPAQGGLFEQATPKPQQPVEKWKLIGKNADGFNVYEDESGVRSFLKGRMRITEPVRMIPTRHGIMASGPVDHGKDYQVVEESAAGKTPPRAVTEAPKGADAIPAAGPAVRADADTLLRVLADNGGEMSRAKLVRAAMLINSRSVPALELLKKSGEVYEKDGVIRAKAADEVRDILEGKPQERENKRWYARIRDAFDGHRSDFAGKLGNAIETRTLDANTKRQILAEQARFLESAESIEKANPDGRRIKDVRRFRAMASMVSDVIEFVENQSSVETQTEQPKDSKPERTPAIDLSAEIASRLASHEAFSGNKNRGLRALAKEITDRYGVGTLTDREIYEAMEAGVNRYIAIGKFDLSVDADGLDTQMTRVRTTVTTLMPTQTVRDARQLGFQQFSTPPDEAMLVGWVANIQKGEDLLEPSAGTGSVAIWGKVAGAKVTANEIDSKRRELLRAQGFKVTEADANYIHFPQVLPESYKPTVVLMNPPFSREGAKGGARNLDVGGNHILAAMDRLADGGRLVAIVGEGMKTNAPRYREFFKQVANRGVSLRANIGISGKVYQPYGTNFGTRVLVFDKTPNLATMPDAEADTLAQAAQLLQGVHDARRLPTTAQSTIAPVARAERESNTAQQTGRPDTAQSEPAKGIQRDAPARPVPVGSRESKPGNQATPDRQPTRNLERPGGVEARRSGTLPNVPVADTGADAGRRDSDRGATATARPTGESADRPKRDTPKTPGTVSELRRRSTGQLAEQQRQQPAREAEPEAELPAASAFRPNNSVAKIEGAQPHPAPLIESAALASVELPPTNYAPNLPQHLIDSGRLSEAQLESIVYAGAAHQQTLKNGARRGFFIGDGCVAAGTRIFNPFTGEHVAIEELLRRGQPHMVLSLTSEGLRPHVATVPFLKGRAELYRVVLDDGRKVTVTSHHRFFTPQGWRKLADGLGVGDWLACAENVPSQDHADGRNDHPENGESWKGTPEDCLGHYSTYRRLYGEQPRLAIADALKRFPSLGDVPEHSHPGFGVDAQATLLTRSRHRRNNGRPSKQGSSLRENRDRVLSANQGDAFSSPPLAVSLPLSAQSQWSKALLRPAVAVTTPRLEGTREADSSDKWLRSSCATEGLASAVPPLGDNEWSGMQLQADLGRLPLNTLQQSVEEDGRQAELYACSLYYHSRWNRIRTVEFIGEAEFYDMYVPGSENYVAEGIIHHNTGLGKGATIAGIILDNWRQGRKKALWITKNNDLFAPTQRDLDWVGLNSKTLLKKQNDTAASDSIKLREGVLFTTFGTLQSGSKKGEAATAKTRVQQLIDWLGKDFDGVIAIDEAHHLQNELAQKGKRGTKDASKTALAGKALREALPKARVVYLSATGATEPENLAYLDRLGLWGQGTPFADAAEFVNSIKTAGLSAMELVAQNLKQMGSYVSRSISFEGVTQNTLVHDLTEDQRSTYDGLSRAWQKISQNINGALEETEGDAQAKSAAMSQFWSQQQRFFNQMLVTMQMPSVVKAIRKDMAEGKSVVLQVVSTFEAQLNETLAAQKIIPTKREQVIDEVDLTPREGLKVWLKNAFPVTQYETVTDADGNEKKQVVMGPDGKPLQNPTAVRMRDRMIASLDDLRMPPDPILFLYKEFGVDAVAEITGRSVMVYENKEGDLVVKKRPDSARKQDVVEFQDGRKRLLIFSRAGGTGASYHADKKTANQQKRVHYLVEAGWQAAEAVQGLGRTHRSNQAQPPHYVLVSTDVKGQKRFISTIARRLEQLGALTRGQRQAGNQSLFSAMDNLEGPYARTALRKVLDDIRANRIEGMSEQDFKEQTGLVLEDNEGKPKDIEVPQFLNRLLSMELDKQNTIFDRFEGAMAQLITRAQEMGTFDEGLEQIKGDNPRILQEKEVWRDEATGYNVKYVEVAVDRVIDRDSFEVVQLRKPERWLRNRKSGAVWAQFKPQDTMSSEGEVVRRVLLQSAGGKQPLAEKDFRLGDYDVLATDTAKKLYNEQLEALPQSKEFKHSLLTGTLLPVWNRLPKANLKAKRAVIGDRRILGMELASKDVEQTLKNFGKAEQEQGADDLSKMNPAQMFERVLKGARIKLGNGITLAKREQYGQSYVEFKDWTNARMLLNAGAREVMMGAQRRLYAPDAATLAKVLDALGNPAVTDVQEKTGTGVEYRSSGMNPFEEVPRVIEGVKRVGRQLAKTREDVEKSPEFQRWFGESKVTDDKGKPLVVYHGTRKSFDRFESQSAPANPYLQDDHQLGFFFDKRPGRATDFGDFTGAAGFIGVKRKESGAITAPEGAVIAPVYLAIQNPKVYGFSEYSQALNEAGGGRQLKARLLADGYDGIIRLSGGQPLHYVAFKPEQIKSATGNRGTFDPKNPDVRYSGPDGPAALKWLKKEWGFTRDAVKDTRAEFSRIRKDEGTGAAVKFAGAEALNTARAVQLSLDIPILRQGGMLNFNITRKDFWQGQSLRRLAAARSAWSDVSFPQAKLALENLEMPVLGEPVRIAHLAHLAGVDFTSDLFNKEADRKGVEEGFESRIGRNLPVIRNLEQFNAVYMDLRRMDVFRRYLDNALKGRELTDAQTQKVLADAAQMVNLLSGRADVQRNKDKSERLTPTNLLLKTRPLWMSAQYLSSRLRLLNPGTYARLEPKVRQAALRDVAGFAAFAYGAAALAALAGASVSLDPDDSDFFKIKIGDTRYDFIAGFGPILRLFWQLGKAGATTVTDDVGGQTAAQVRRDTANEGARFLRGKLGALPSLGATWWNDWTEITGEKVTPGDAVLSRVTPLMLQDVKTAIAAEDKTALVKLAPALIGAGVQQYNNPRNRARLMLQNGLPQRREPSVYDRTFGARALPGEAKPAFTQRRARYEALAKPTADALQNDPRYQGADAATRARLQRSLNARLSAAGKEEKPLRPSNLTPDTVLNAVQKKQREEARKKLRRGLQPGQ